MLKVLLQKIIEEILIRKVILLVKGSFSDRSFTENYRRNLDEKGSLTHQRFFYSLKVLFQKIIEEILIKKVLLLIKGSFPENYRRNLDQKGSIAENYRRHLDQKGSFTR